MEVYVVTLESSNNMYLTWETTEKLIGIYESIELAIDATKSVYNDDLKAVKEHVPEEKISELRKRYVNKHMEFFYRKYIDEICDIYENNLIVIRKITMNERIELE